MVILFRNEELDAPLDMTLKIQMAYMLSNKQRGTITKDLHVGSAALTVKLFMDSSEKGT